MNTVQSSVQGNEQNHPRNSIGYPQVENIEHTLPHPSASEQIDPLIEENLPSSQRQRLTKDMRYVSLSLDSTLHQGILDLARDLDQHLRVAVRYSRLGISDFFSGILAYTVGIDDTELFNFQLLRNPRVIAGLIEGATFGIKAIEYNRERIPHFPGIQSLGVQDLQKYPSGWLGIVRDPCFWMGTPDVFSIEIVHIDQLRAIATNTGIPCEQECFISIWSSRHARDLEDSRRKKITSPPDIHCSIVSIDSKRRQAEWRSQLSKGKLYTLPLEATLVHPIIESAIAEYAA